MTAHRYRPYLRHRRFDPWRALGAALCLSSAAVTGVVLLWLLAAVVAWGTR